MQDLKTAGKGVPLGGRPFLGFRPYLRALGLRRARIGPALGWLQACIS